MIERDATENVVDPQLLLPPPSQSSSRAGSVGTSSQHNKRDAGADGDGDGDGDGDVDRDGDGDDDSVHSGAGPRKRQKLNLYKCNQCRLARKKASTIPPPRDPPRIPLHKNN